MSAGGLIFFPSVKKGVGTFVVRDLGLEKSTLDLHADEELYTWARTQTPKDSLFYYGSPLFRYRAQRSITHALDLLSHREARYVEIYKRYNRLEKAYEDPVRLLQEARSLQANYLVVEKSRNLCLPLTLVFENNKYLVYQLSPELAEKVPPQQLNKSVSS